MLREGENLVTFARIYQKNYGGDLKKKIQTYTTAKDRIEYVLDMPRVKETVFQTLEHNRELFQDVPAEQMNRVKRHRGR